MRQYGLRLRVSRGRRVGEAIAHMSTDHGRLSASEHTELVVRQYFAARLWTVAKLDSGKEKAADFRICDDSTCFLNEVKTVKSVRANFPHTSPDSFHKERTRHRSEIEVWKHNNPDQRLILLPDEWEFIYGDEMEFTKRYGHRRRNTEAWFGKFAETLRGNLLRSVAGDFPYALRLDSDDLYTPDPRESEQLTGWLVTELQAIAGGKPSRHWQVDSLPAGRTHAYTTFYPIHRPAHDDDTKSIYQLMVVGPYAVRHLQVEVFSYGGLNLDAFESNLQSGLEQLNASAAREKNQYLPRVITLAFESGIGFERPELSSYLAEFLENHRDLSALAILDWTFDGSPPAHEADFIAWATYTMTASKAPWFCVYHNRRLENVEPLPTHAFNDKWSMQLTPMK
jgi:hypothetical protein